MPTSGRLNAGSIVAAIAIVAAFVVVGVIMVLRDPSAADRTAANRARTSTLASRSPRSVGTTTTLPVPLLTALLPTSAPNVSRLPATRAERDFGLTEESRLGYAGLGPIQLGMTLDDAARAGLVSFRVRDCSHAMDPGAGSGLDPIPELRLTNVGGRFVSSPTGQTVSGLEVLSDGNVIDGIHIETPEVLTISGIHVGSSADDVRETYANVVERQYEHLPDGSGRQALIITNPEGRQVYFNVDADSRVSSMGVTVSAAASEGHSRC